MYGFRPGIEIIGLRGGPEIEEAPVSRIGKKDVAAFIRDVQGERRTVDDLGRETDVLQQFASQRDAGQQRQCRHDKCAQDGEADGAMQGRATTRQGVGREGIGLVVQCKRPALEVRQQRTGKQGLVDRDRRAVTRIGREQLLRAGMQRLDAIDAGRHCHDAVDIAQTRGNGACQRCRLLRLCRRGNSLCKRGRRPCPQPVQVGSQQQHPRADEVERGSPGVRDRRCERGEAPGESVERNQPVLPDAAADGGPGLGPAGNDRRQRSRGPERPID